MKTGCVFTIIADPHQSDKVDPDPEQFADDKPKSQHWSLHCGNLLNVSLLQVAMELGPGILDLPVETLVPIILYFDHSEIFHLKDVCLKFHSVCISSSVW
jgi:hypothetical protein